MSDGASSSLEAVLRLCAAAEPGPWYPRGYAEARDIPWESLIFYLEYLFLEGLLEKVPGIPGKGPAFRPTALGQRVLADPEALARLRAGSVAPPGDRGAAVRSALRAPAVPVVTRLLLLANLLVFGYGVYRAGPGRADLQAFLTGPSLLNGQLGNAKVAQVLHQSGALHGMDLVRGEWWRLLATGFVHIGVLHLLMNMYVLRSAGRQAESMWGHGPYLVLYLAGLLGGSCAGVANNPGIMGAGASGALCGLLASEAVWLALNRRYLPRGLVLRWRTGLVSTFLLIVFLSLLPGVSGWGHLGGALAGAAAALVLNYQRFGRPPWRWLALVGLVPVFAAGFIAIEQARRTKSVWHKLERLDFRQRIAPPVLEAVQQADRIYQQSALPQLQRHPRRRDPAAVEKAQDELKEALLSLETARDELRALLPYRAPSVEEERQAVTAVVEAEAGMVQAVGECLANGERCTSEEEKQLNEKVERAEAEWKKCVRLLRR